MTKELTNTEKVALIEKIRNRNPKMIINNKVASGLANELFKIKETMHIYTPNLDDGIVAIDSNMNRLSLDDDNHSLAIFYDFDRTPIDIQNEILEKIVDGVFSTKTVILLMNLDSDKEFYTSPLDSLDLAIINRFIIIN